MKRLSTLLGFLLIFIWVLPAQSLRIADDMGLMNQFQQGEKPRIINFWATWCKPCMEEMPHFIKADSLFGDKIDFVFVSFDRVRDTNRVMNKITELKIPGQHVLIKSPDMGNLINAVDSSWGGALPTTWYAFGQYKASRQEAFEQFADLRRFIETFLNKEE
jgi:thiol-disulfide isomerase/thioredoxin